jgi:autotransporter passenger strand-loop-strand repeat protein
MGTTVGKGNSPYNVSSGHTDTNDVVVSGGSMFVLSGGTANTTAVSSGGIMTIKNGGVASGTTVFAGGTEIISSGGIDVNATVNSGGTIEFFGGIAAPYYSLAGSIIEVISGFFPGPLFALGSVTVIVFSGGTDIGATLRAASRLAGSRWQAMMPLPSCFSATTWRRASRPQPTATLAS